MARVTAFVAGVVVSLALGVIAFPLARYDDGVDDGDRVQGVVTPVVRETDSPRDANLHLQWSQPAEVRTDTAAGLVTAVALVAGTPIACGSVGFVVDGRPIVMYCGATPLWRVVDGRTRGADADELLEWVRGLGIAVADEPSNSQRDRALRELQAMIGWQTTGALSPSDFVWLSTPMTPTQVQIEVGDRLVGGDLIATVDATIVATELDASANGGTLMSLAGSSERFPLGADGQIVDLAGVTAAVLSGVPPGEGLPRSVAVVVRAAVPSSAFVLPASTVVVDGDTSCVRIRSGSGVSRAVEVVVVDSVSDSVFVTGDLSETDAVEVDPDRSNGC